MIKTRRSFLSTVSISGLIALSGCAGDGGSSNPTSEQTSTSEKTDGGWSPIIRSTEPEVSSDEETIITTEADSVAGLNYTALPDRELFDFATNEARVSPDTSGGYDSDPPIWQWESRISVKVEVPVHVTEDADPGKYEYSVQVYDDEDVLQAESVTESFTISVIDDAPTLTEEPEPKSPEEIRECLPEYDEPPADEDEQHERADKIYQEMYGCLEGHDWFWSSGRGYDDENNEWYVVVNVFDREPAEEHFPQEWGSVPIRIRVGEPPEPE